MSNENVEVTIVAPCPGKASERSLPSEVRQPRLLEPRDVLLLLHELWTIATSLHLGITDRSLSVRSVLFHLFQSVTEADKLGQNRELCTEATEVERRIAILKSLSLTLGNLVPSVDTKSAEGSDQQGSSVGELLELRESIESGSSPVEASNALSPPFSEEPNPEKVKGLIFRAVEIVDLLVVSKSNTPLSGAISVAAGMHLLDEDQIRQDPMSYIGDLCLKIVKSRADCDQHLGQAWEGIKYLVQLGGDWSIDTAAKVARAIGLDATGYANSHCGLLSQTLGRINAFSRILLNWSGENSVPPLGKTQMVALINALYEGCTHLRNHDRSELLPTLQLVLNNQALIREIVDSPESFGELTSDPEASFDSFLARTFGVLSWTAEFNPPNRMLVLHPLSLERPVEGTSPLWDLISVDTFCVLLESVLGDRFVNSEDWTEHHDLKYLIGIAINSLFRVFRHRSIVEKLSSIQGSQGKSYQPQDIGRWLCNGVTLLHRHLQFDDQELSTAQAWKLASVVAQLKVVFSEVGETSIGSEKIFFTIDEQERRECFRKVEEFGTRLNQYSNELFREALGLFQREAQVLVSTGKLHPYPRPAELLFFRQLISSNRKEELSETALPILECLRAYDQNEWREDQRQRVSFDTQRAIRRLQRTTSHCAAYLMALVRSSGSEDLLTALNWTALLVELTLQPAVFKEYLPVWRSFYNEQRIPCQRDILHSLVMLETWIASVLTSEDTDLRQDVITVLDRLGISTETALSVKKHCLMSLLPQDLRSAMASTLERELNPGQVRHSGKLRFGQRLNSFEAAVEPHIKSFLRKQRPGITYELRSSSFFMMYEVDFLVFATFEDGTEQVVVIRCNGEAWHRIFGDILSDTDRVKNKVLVNAMHYIDMAPVIKVIEVRQSEFQTKSNPEEQEVFIHALLTEALKA